MPKYETLCPKNYELDVYPGCSFGCVYCIAKDRARDNAVSAFDIDNFKKNLVLKNKHKYPVYLSPWSDAYQHAEKNEKKTCKIVHTLSELDFPFFIITRSSLVLRDIDLLRGLKKSFVAISINTLDPLLIRRLEPYVPPISERMEVVHTLINNNIKTVVKIDPIIPGITDGNILEHLVSWLQEVKPHAVTVETLRLTKNIANNLFHVLSQDEYNRMLAHYTLLENDPTHPDLSYRLTLFRHLADQFGTHGIKASFCRASLPEKITPYDCRGGF